MDPEVYEELEHFIKIAAAQVARRYRGFSTFDDLVQEGYVWALKHPKTVQSRLEDGRRGEHRLIQGLARHMEKQARRERAASLGYRPEDEAFYQRQLIEAALPAVWDDDMLTNPPFEAEEGPKRRTDGSETPNWLVTVLDVREAWRTAEMDLDWRVAMAYRYADDMRIYQIADAMEIAPQTVSRYIDRGINAMIAVLGGRHPGQCNPECECGEGKRAGYRRVMSNAEAQARTDDDYDE